MTNNKRETISVENTAFPIFRLLIITAALFLSILTEALPAGFLYYIGESFSVTQPQAGQWVTVYAIGSLLSAIPLTLVTQHWSRKTLLLLTLAGFTISNGLNSVVDSFPVTLVTRFLSGISAGLLWALAAGYASRMVSPERQGRAITIVMTGVPLALSLGVPVGTFLGDLYGWRTVFYIITALSSLLFITGVYFLPEQAGVRQTTKISVSSVIALTGMRTVFCTTFLFSLGHNMMYTYISPYLQQIPKPGIISVFLLIFGIMAVISIFAVGIFIDNHLRRLILIGLSIFISSSLILFLSKESVYLVFLSAALWGLGFGGGATLFQTASARTSGDAADIAQSLMVTIWNIAIAGGGLLGGGLLSLFDVHILPVTLCVMLVLCFILVKASTARGLSNSINQRE